MEPPQARKVGRKEGRSGSASKGIRNVMADMGTIGCLLLQPLPGGISVDDSIRIQVHPHWPEKDMRMSAADCRAAGLRDPHPGPSSLAREGHEDVGCRLQGCWIATPGALGDGLALCHRLRRTRLLGPCGPCKALWFPTLAILHKHNPDSANFFGHVSGKKTFETFGRCYNTGLVVVRRYPGKILPDICPKQFATLVRDDTCPAKSNVSVREKILHGHNGNTAREGRL